MLKRESNVRRRARRGQPAAMSPIRELRLLHDLVGEINAGQTLEDVLTIAFARMRRLIPYHRISIATYDPATDRLTLAAVRSSHEGGLQTGYSAPVAGSSLEPLIRRRRLRILNDLEAYLRQHPDSKSTATMLREGTRASLTVPLALAGRPVGVLFFSSDKPNTYRPAHATLIRGIVHHIAAIVEKARLADALRTTHQRLESVLRDSADGILVLDQENHILHWNRGAERIFGFTASEMLGQPFDRLLPADLRQAGELQQLRDRIRADGFLTNYETRRLTRDGREITVNITSTLLHDPDGRPFGRSSIVRDVTALRAMQEELLRTRNLAALGEMAASVAHEIRNPLAGISGAIQVLRDTLPADDTRRDVIAKILANVSRLDNTIRDLLVFSKPWKPEKRACNLAEIVADAVTTLRHQPAYREIRFTLDESPLTLHVDPLLLSEVLTNLFQNAAQAMEGRGSIACSLVREDRFGGIRVTDTGPGIAPAIQPRLFTPFFTTKTNGSGLGLAICRKIMEAHGGSIALAALPERGAEVILRLPLENPA